ncbi:calcitonin/calcitonin-related polypeptide, alpha [Paralichthys olivaceus]|nr:PREDICTED: calcitonin-1-like isoform X1 [Paralichthys olivaceus]XP_019954282.1 PREDICTED: calcitonin-1-like isoform X1 [Paralichthys olivaceus]
MGNIYKTLHCGSAQQIQSHHLILYQQKICYLMGVMIMLKLWTLLLGNALIICQIYISQAAPSRSGNELMSDGVTLTNEDAQSFLRAFKELMQITSDEQDPRAADGLDRAMSKRCTGLSTCVLGKLSQDIHKLQTYPRTNVGAGTPGKKRSLSEQYENHGSSYN